MPKRSDIAFIYSSQAMAPGDPNKLNGIPLAIEEHYENAVKKASWFVWKSMWRASVGVVKGMVVAGAIAATAVAGAALFYGAATTGFSMQEGLNVVYNAIVSNPGISATATGLILSTGAAAGAVYEISNYRDDVQKDLIKSRQMMRDLRGVIRDQELGVARAHEHQAMRQAIAHDFDAMGEINNPQGQQEWVQRSTQRQQDRLAQMQDEAEAPRNEINSMVAREEARRQKLRNQERSV